MGISKIWVFAEATDGKVSNTTLEILAKARELADTVEVVTAAGGDIAATVGANGATKVYTVAAEGKLLGAPVAGAIAAAIEAGNGPDAVLLATSYDGRDVAGRLSVKVDAPVITNVVEPRRAGRRPRGCRADLRWHHRRDHQVHRPTRSASS